MKINEIVTEGKGLWANIHAKRERIKNGSGERMRKPGSKGAPTAKNFKDAANEGVAEGSLNEFAPGGNDGDDRDYEYEVYQCNPKDQFDWVGGPIYKTDDMAKAHGVAYNLNKKHPNKAFMIWQERSQGSRGGYGIKDDEQGVAEGLPQTLRKVVPGHAKREIDKKMDAGKFGKTDADKDANFHRYKKIQDKLKESEQVFKVIAVDKSNYLGGKEEMTVKADSIEDLFSRLSANDWYPLEINGVEVVAGKRLKQGVAEGSPTDFAGRPVDQELVNRQEKYWNQVAKEKKDKEKAALRAAQSDYEKTPQGKAEKYWSKKGVAEGSLEEYGDTAKGQKMLTKVQKRAVDRVVSKKADTDPKYARKNADTADRAWERMTDKDVAEGSEEGSYSDKFVQSQIDYYTKHGLSGTAADRERINGSLNYYQHIKNKRIKDGTWQEQGVAEDSNEVDYPVELSAEIINWIKKTYPTATVAQLRDKSWIADKVKEYHREPKVLSGVRQAAQDAGRLEESMLEETYDGDEFYEAYGDLWYDEEQLNEAEYQGRKVQLGKPVRSSNGPKKFHVFVKDPSTGNVKKVNFGDKNMRIKKSDPARRKSFRARHNCANPGPRTKAKYWSCRNW